MMRGSVHRAEGEEEDDDGGGGDEQQEEDKWIRNPVMDSIIIRPVRYQNDVPWGLNPQNLSRLISISILVLVCAYKPALPVHGISQLINLKPSATLLGCLVIWYWPWTVYAESQVLGG